MKATWWSLEAPDGERASALSRSGLPDIMLPRRLESHVLIRHRLVSVGSARARTFSWSELVDTLPEHARGTIEDRRLPPTREVGSFEDPHLASEWAELKTRLGLEDDAGLFIQPVVLHLSELRSILRCLPPGPFMTWWNTWGNASVGEQIADREEWLERIEVAEALGALSPYPASVDAVNGVCLAVPDDSWSLEPDWLWQCDPEDPVSVVSGSATLADRLVADAVLDTEVL